MIFNLYFATVSLAQLSNCECLLGFRYRILHECLFGVAIKLKFHLLGKDLGLTEKSIDIVNDLVITRIAHPASKIESFDFISDYFAIKHSRRDFYRVLSELPKMKDDVERKIIAVAKKHFGFNFSLVFYDLTTLYFESFETDDLRKIGFSKDNKSANPQVMIGLMVNDLGFPISYQLFSGNKFEGHTLMPSILALKKKYKIKKMTVVADSAMISDDNITFLKSENINYIVAARTANLPIKTIEEVSHQLNQKDEAIMSLSQIKLFVELFVILIFSNARTSRYAYL